MAVSDAVRRSGSLLLRTLAVGGLTTAAWLVCAGVASAEDHLDDVVGDLDVADLVFEEPRVGVAELLAEARPQHEPLGIVREPLGIVEVPALTFADRPAEEPSPVFVTAAFADLENLEDFRDSQEFEGSGGPSYSGGSHSAHSHSGTASNTLPAPAYEAKVAAKAAARAAAAVVLAPPPPAQAPPPAAPVAPEVRQSPAVDTFPVTAAQAVPLSQPTPTVGVTWEVPEPNAPAPAPKQAPAPSAPTASSSSASDNGGGHRGGVIASLTGQSDVRSSAAWSTERRDDGRSPGSVPGLPSTSPD